MPNGGSARLILLKYILEMWKKLCYNHKLTVIRTMRSIDNTLWRKQNERKSRKIRTQYG